MLMAHVGVQCNDNPWKEAAFWSVCSAFSASVPLQASAVQIS